MFAGLTVEENLQLAERKGVAPDYDTVYELFPELKVRRKQRAGSLSGGQQQMVSLGRVLLNEARLLLVDEPTKGLAPKLVTEVADALAVAAERTTILVVEQSLPMVRRIADHVVVIDMGQVAHTGPATGFLSDDALMNQLLGVAAADHQERA